MELANITAAISSLSQAAAGGGLMSSVVTDHPFQTSTSKQLQRKFSAVKTSPKGAHCGLNYGLRLQAASSNATKSIDLKGNLPPNLRKLERCYIDIASNAIMDVGDDDVNHFCLDDIVGLDHVKKWATETIIWPLLRPDFFIRSRSPSRSLLLFGPSGAGKTMIGKAIAREAKATFFYISPSSFTTQYEWGIEKQVRALFGVAEYHQPSVIFVDQVDEVLSKRRSLLSFEELGRALTAKFLIEMDGLESGNKQIFVIGATNRPQELDDTIINRFVKRLYIPPSSEGRAYIIRNYLGMEKRLFELSDEEIDSLCKLTEGSKMVVHVYPLPKQFSFDIHTLGYTTLDLKALVRRASMGPARESSSKGIGVTEHRNEDVKPVTFQDFEKSLKEVNEHIHPDMIEIHENKIEEWNDEFGSSMSS